MKIITGIIIFLCLSGCSIYISDENFFNPSENTLTPFFNVENDYYFSEHEVYTSDGYSLKGGSYKSKKNKYSIIYYGGNNAVKNNYLIHLYSLALKLKVNVYMFDRRGYGDSDGVTSSETLLDDALLVYDYVSKNEDYIIVHGHSLGSFEAAFVAKSRDAFGVVLESPATNAKDVVDATVPWYIDLFTSITIEKKLAGFDNSRISAEIDEPILILVGSEDSNTPPKFAKEIFDNSLSKCKDLFIFEGANHNSIPQHKDFLDVYKKFILNNDNEGCEFYGG
ncbi:alpha/beta hydrolase [Pseudoalteromonas 'SMAR']|uniref:alpha/beta hydrolase n=1 Tax=Pseudoalteromonas 'SMAR' TaxID=3416908 RepID=UPI003AF315C1